MQTKNTLLLGIIFIIVFLVIFALVAYGVTASFDDSVFTFINSGLNVNSLNFFFIVATNYGREYFWIPVVMLLWLFGKKNEKRAALVLVIVFIILIITGEALKYGYYRARPPLSLSNALLLVPLDSDSSFPSGHALIVMGGAVVSLLMLRKRYSLPLLTEALVVCYSRIYVGVHYPMDVLGGAVLGAGVALTVAYILLNASIFESFFNSLVRTYNEVLHRMHLI